jgi:predicted DNA-binding transcriptional regulator AlpA
LIRRNKAPRLLSANDAAEYVGIGRKTFLAEVPFDPIRVGSRLYYDARAIDSWIDRLSGFTLANDNAEQPHNLQQGLDLYAARTQA